MNAQLQALVTLVTEKTDRFGTAEQLGNLVAAGLVDQAKLESFLVQAITGQTPASATLAKEMVENAQHAPAREPEITSQPSTEPSTSEAPKGGLMDKLKQAVETMRSNTAANYEKAKKTAERKAATREELLTQLNPILVEPTPSSAWIDGEHRFFAGLNVNGQPGVLLDNEDPGKFFLSPEMGILVAIDLRISQGAGGKRRGFWIDNSNKAMACMSVRQMARVANVTDHKFDDVFARRSVIPKGAGFMLKLKMDANSVRRGILKLSKPKFGSDVKKATALTADSAKVVNKLKGYLTVKHNMGTTAHLVGFAMLDGLHKSLEKGEIRTFAGLDDIVGSLTAFVLWELDTTYSDDATPLQMGPHQIMLDGPIPASIKRTGENKVLTEETRSKAIQDAIARKDVNALLELAKSGDAATIAQINAAIQATAQPEATGTAIPEVQAEADVSFPGFNS